ncbi:MAG: PepSY-like domain-containing protein [Acidobacteria bacterium]|nr:PepSY-like domain-containing protein [Acidobacteriota bacterium]
MKSAFFASAAFTSALAGLLTAQDSETRVKLKDLPPAVQAAVAAQSKGATLKGLTREAEHGLTRYEAEFRVKGRTKDITFDETGKIVSLEEEVPLASIPAAAREAVEKSIGTGKLLLVETVTEDGATFYEAHMRKDGKEIEIKVDASGRPVK